MAPFPPVESHFDKFTFCPPPETLREDNTNWEICILRGAVTSSAIFKKVLVNETPKETPPNTSIAVLFNEAQAQIS